MIEESKENFEKYLKHKEKTHKITLIKGQTALGKTTAYGTVIKDVAIIDKFVIAVPTIPLKNQVYKDLVGLGITDIMKTPELPYIYDNDIRQKSNHLMEIGAFGERKKFLEISIEKLCKQKETILDTEKSELIEKDIKNISYYLEQNEIVNHYEGTVVTTWARLFHLHWCLVFTHSLIIDEDILRECITNKTYNLKKLRTTCECLKCNYETELKQKVDMILNAPYKTIKAVKPIYSEKIPSKKLKEIEEEISLERRSIYNIFDILSISAIYKYNVDKEKMKRIYHDDDLVHCLICRQPPNMTTFVLSATLEKDFYIDYFYDRDVEYIEIPPDKYTGTVIQDCSYSYSRTCLEKHPDILKTIRAKHKRLPLITFKKFCDKEDYNFGAVEGLNVLKRKKYCGGWLTLLK